jgi:hypothetical protein
MNKKWKIALIILGVIAVLGIGIGSYFAFFKDSKKSDSAKKNSGEESAKEAETPNEFSDVTPTSPSILFATHDPNLPAGSYKWTDNLYNLNPVKKASKEISAANTLTSSGFESVYANNSVQWSSDGKVMAYAFGDDGGMMEPATPNSFKLTVVNGGVSTVVLSNLEVAQVPKWLLVPDGTSIIYIKGDKADDTATYSLNKYNVVANIHTVLAADITTYAKNSCPFSVSPDGTKLYLFASKTSDNNNLYQYKFDLAANIGVEKKMLDGVDGSTAFMGKFSASDISMSPDGTMLAYRKKVSETRHGIALYKLADNSTKDIYSPDDKRSVNNIMWSPDSTSIAFETTFFGAGDGAGQLQGIYKVVVASSDSVAIAESDVGGNYITLGFSPDGKKIAYVFGKTLNYYDLSAQVAIEVHKTAEGSLSLKGFAWAGF